QLLMQHLTAAPDLTPLPVRDRPAVAQALAKAPDERFASCLEFVQALVAAEGSGPADGAGRAAAPGATPLPQSRAALAAALPAATRRDKPGRAMRRTRAVRVTVQPTRADRGPAGGPDAG